VCEVRKRKCCVPRFVTHNILVYSVGPVRSVIVNRCDVAAVTRKQTTPTESQLLASFDRMTETQNIRKGATYQQRVCSYRRAGRGGNRDDSMGSAQTASATTYNSDNSIHHNNRHFNRSKGRKIRHSHAAPVCSARAGTKRRLCANKG